MRHNLAIIIIFSATTVYGQDLHFSQFYLNPATITPAAPAMERGDMRAAGLYRSQWQSVPVAYETFSGSFDYTAARSGGSLLRLGLQLQQDKAGDGGLEWLQAGLNAAVGRQISARHRLGAGFGLLKGMVLCLIITMFAMTLLGASQQQRIANSKSGLYISRILANADGILPVEIKQIVGPYISDVGNRLQQSQSGLGVPAGDGPLEGLGRMIQERVSQFGNDALNGQQQQQPGGFLTGQAGSPQNQGGGFFGPGQGAPTNAQLSWPAPPAQPQPGSGWPSGFQSGSGGNDVLPR